ncbi:MAG: hypothetical protein OEZ22_13170 [Spirochaetia bacterium]|nr:hypothetical protein [Spirochaetia bacterium]
MLKNKKTFGIYIGLVAVVFVLAVFLFHSNELSEADTKLLHFSVNRYLLIILDNI